MRFRCGFDYDRKTSALGELEKKTHAESFWNDQSAAQKTMKEIADLREEVDELGGIGRSLAEARETLEVLGDEAGAAEEVARLLAGAEAKIDRLEMAATFDREYDAHGAIVTIHAGAGGIDAADWTQMLSRMYLRWAETKGFNTQIAEESPAEEAGLKSITFFIHGRNAFGMLDSERGVHRLPRSLPLRPRHQGHTLFCQ